MFSSLTLEANVNTVVMSHSNSFTRVRLRWSVKDCTQQGRLSGEYTGGKELAIGKSVVPPASLANMGPFAFFVLITGISLE